jgi:hypothetical protein
MSLNSAKIIRLCRGGVNHFFNIINCMAIWWTIRRFSTQKRSLLAKYSLSVFLFPSRNKIKYHSKQHDPYICDAYDHKCLLFFFFNR